MTRLEVLKAEKEQIKGLRCLSFGLIDKCIEWYDKEIEAIVIHGADNKFYGQQADGEYISKGKMLMFLNDMRFGIAPDETVADDDERREREAQVDVLDDLMEVVEQMPSVAIPPDHDGCKDCVYQTNPQDAMPCRECKHNYMDKWKARPSAEPRKVLYSGDGYADGEMVYDMAECPNCGREFEDGDETWNCNFCPDCGQALKWEGEEE